MRKIIVATIKTIVDISKMVIKDIFNKLKPILIVGTTFIIVCVVFGIPFVISHALGGTTIFHYFLVLAGEYVFLILPLVYSEEIKEQFAKNIGAKED